MSYGGRVFSRCGTNAGSYVFCGGYDSGESTAAASTSNWSGSGVGDHDGSTASCGCCSAIGAYPPSANGNNWARIACADRLASHATPFTRSCLTSGRLCRSGCWLPLFVASHGATSPAFASRFVCSVCGGSRGVCSDYGASGCAFSQVTAVGSSGRR